MFKLLKLLTKTLLSLSIVLLSMSIQADVIDGEDLVDPTRPLGFIAGNNDDDSFLERFTGILPTSFDVTFIRAGSSNSIAVINEERVTIGDNIGGAEVVGIQRSSVTLLINGEETVISLYDSVKSAASN